MFLSAQNTTACNISEVGKADIGATYENASFVRKAVNPSACPLAKRQIFQLSEVLNSPPPNKSSCSASEWPSVWLTVQLSTAPLDHNTQFANLASEQPRFPPLARTRQRLTLCRAPRVCTLGVRPVYAMCTACASLFWGRAPTVNGPGRCSVGRATALAGLPPPTPRNRSYRAAAPACRPCPR